MSNWISITIDTLREAKVSVLVDACSSAAKAQGQPDRASGIIQGVVDHVRRKIASNPSNRLDADPTRIPKGLRDLAVDLIMARLKIAVERALKEDERLAVQRHERDLDRIADGRDTVEQPDEPVPASVEAGTIRSSISARPRRFGREAQEGI